MHTFAQRQQPAQKAKSASSAMSDRALSGQSRGGGSILHFQPTIGTHAVQRLLRPNTEAREEGSAPKPSAGFAHDFSRLRLHCKALNEIQSGPTETILSDLYEQEADSVAHQVMRKPGLKGTGARAGAYPKCLKEPDNQERFQSSSQPRSVPQAIRRPMELALRHDFSDVRIHHDETAVRRVRVARAMALTSGRKILLDRGQVSLDSSAGQHILAHELVHVAQQATNRHAPSLQAYRPQSEDPIHEPMLEEYQLRYPDSAPGRPSAGQIKYQLTPLLMWSAVLNTGSRANAEYQRALQAWPNRRQIWPHLHSRRARIEFIRYLLEFDRTNCRPYSPAIPGQEPGCDTFARNHETFRNVCQGYATQLHLRLRAQPAPPDAAQIERLRTRARIYYQAIDVKFRIPILMASVPGHAFNAILVGRTPSSIDSYLFVEPQTDSLFEPSSAEFGHNFRVGLLTLSELREFNERGQYIQATRRAFVRDPFGRAVAAELSGPERVALHRVYAAVFIADDGMDTWRATIEARRTTYENHIRNAVAGISDEHFLLAARYAIGRYFRRSPGGTQERLTIDTFLRLVNRESLRERLQQQQQSIPQPPPEPAVPSASELG